MTYKKFNLLLVFQLILSIFVIVLSSYSVITSNFRFQPVSFMLLSVLFIMIAIREYKMTQSLVRGIFYFGTSLFLLFVAFQNFLIH